MSLHRTEYTREDNHVADKPGVNGLATDTGIKPPFMIHVHVKGRIHGHDMEVTAAIELRHIATFAHRLSALGFAGIAQPLAFDRTADGLPICPKHHMPMRKKEKQGDQWHSHRIMDSDGRALYCRGYPGPDSPGYGLDSPDPEAC